MGKSNYCCFLCVIILLLCIINTKSTTEEPNTNTITLLQNHNQNQFTTNETYSEIPTQPPPITPSNSNSLPTKSKIVTTKYGKLQGISLSLFPFLGIKSGSPNSGGPIKNKIVEIFLGIPYASVPIRFTPTQTPIPWNGIKSTVTPGPVCPQMFPDIRSDGESLKEMPRGYLEYLRRVEPYLRNQSEDCLYLNIYSPIGPDPTLKPVLVYVHGGKFSWGSGNLIDGTVLSAYADIIVVTFNYRLGVLGFLNLNTNIGRKPEVANYGLLDQIAAVHWIKENIVFFGGDPENITLMGYEAGAASIHFLMSSPAVMPGLFHRSILIGGSSYAPWAIVSDPSAAANSLAQYLNCTNTTTSTSNTNSSSNGSLTNINTIFNQTPSSYHQGKSTGSQQPINPIIQCLKSKHFNHFSNYSPHKFSVQFGPTVDGIVIKPYFRTSKESMGKRDLIKKYDILFGLSSLEKMTEFSETDLTFGFEGGRRDAILRTVIRNSYRFHLNEILATIINEYTDWERSVQHPIATRDLTINAVTDCLSLAPVIAASESSLINKGYFYIFDHATRDGLYNYQRTGAGGGEELIYLFGSPLIELISGQVLSSVPTPYPGNFTKAEMALSELMITLLSNFVHTSDPNEPVKQDLIWPLSKERNRFRSNPWESYDRLSQKYLEITANKIKMKSHYRAHQMAIWLRLVPELQRSGAHYASSIHNRMKGGNDPSLYVGSIRNSFLGEEDILNPQLFDVGFDGINGVEIGDEIEGPPSPPTTCFSPVSSLKNSSINKDQSNINNQTIFDVSNIFAPYSTALSVTIAVGCSLLILNVFIFALVWYQRDKRRSVLKNSQSTESETSQKYLEPPELLKSNSTTATSIHQSNSTSTFSQTGGIDHYHSCGSSLQPSSQYHRGILLSPSQAHSHNNTLYSTSASHLLGIGSFNKSNGGIGLSTLPKPPPPPRSISHFSTLQLQHKGSQSNIKKIQSTFEELNV